MNFDLLNQQFEPCVIMDKTTYRDGYGSVKTKWTEGAEIEAFIRFDDGTMAQIANKAYGISNVTIITNEDVVLMVNDVVKRISDSKVFLVTSDADDYKVPESASGFLKKKKVKASEWVLPTN